LILLFFYIDTCRCGTRANATPTGLLRLPVNCQLACVAEDYRGSTGMGNTALAAIHDSVMKASFPRFFRV
jgi:hypothetical protein